MMHVQITDLDRLIKEARLLGLIDGLTAFAWWRDGVQYVGTTGTTLQSAIQMAREGKLWNQTDGAYPAPAQEN